MRAPILTGQAREAALHRGSHVQIIASAGSGKTEVVSQRVATLLGEGVPASSIVAFTFTERAAAELRHRIAQRAQELVGPEVVDQLGSLFVGTIHAWCFQFLQMRVPRYETYDVLDDHQLTAFLSREANRLEIRQLDSRNRLFASISTFLSGVGVVENELLDPAALEEPFATIMGDYLATLERYRLLTFGQQVARAVEELTDPDVRGRLHGELSHLIVDEYQDVNPAQERLIELMAGPDVQLCVVGDDDQSIYQWRGSDVANIVTFPTRYDGVTTFQISTNRRSRPQIIERANRFATSIPGRLPKDMHPFRDPGGSQEIAVWTADTEAEEAGWIADLILDLHEEGLPFSAIAVLVRGRASYPALMDAFATFDIPVQPAGRTGLFEQADARLLGQTFAWLSDIDWRDRFGPGAPVDERTILRTYEARFDLDSTTVANVRSLLHDWRSLIPQTSRTANLVGEVYELLGTLGIAAWDLNDPMQLNRLGTLARFTQLLADFESVRRRARPDPDNEGEQVGGQDRGAWYYKNLAIHIINYANGAYEGFDGEDDFNLDAVDLTTVHAAKGLEWPAVLVPAVTGRRFPSSRTGQSQDWPFSRTHFNAARYEGSDADERRLFYVAMTRARDWLSVSCHRRVTRQTSGTSPYHRALDDLAMDPADITLPTFEIPGPETTTIELTFSELAAYLDCAMAYRLRSLVGFQPRLAPELGYGKAVHHLLRSVAERTKVSGRTPTRAEVAAIMNADFFLPTASKPAHRQLKDAARRLVQAYIDEHAQDLHRVWETERPFELHLDGITITGRADVILDEEGGVPTSLAILDYKTSTSVDRDHDLQLQVYTDAGRREGLDVRGAYVHDLKAGARHVVDVGADQVTDAELRVLDARERLRQRDYTPDPSPSKCRVCEVRTVCAARS